MQRPRGGQTRETRPDHDHVHVRAHKNPNRPDGRSLQRDGSGCRGSRVQRAERPAVILFYAPQAAACTPDAIRFHLLTRKTLKIPINLVFFINFD
jgi:hypothetical protein